MSLSTYVFFNEEKRGLKALVSSWCYVKNYGWAVFGRLLFLWVLTIPIYLLLGLFGKGSGASLIQSAVSLFIVVPLSLIYPYHLYLSLKAAKPPLSEEEESKIKKRITLFIAIGAVALVLILVFAGSLAVKFIQKISQFRNS
ncbi:MAG: hypothetical protein HY093_00460 [Candidatus Liptonbacteria bacterium]|nr:hypothetical protein [Candidatus Liptonbacteria bacterium]